MPNIERIKKYNKIHMVGIGGVSMSGIAEILVNWGFTVTGSNNVENENTKKLEKAGIKITDEDMMVGEILMKYAANTGITKSNGWDDIGESLVGFTYEPKVSRLLKGYPEIVALISKISRDNNAFVDSKTGKVEQAGTFGSVSPIYATRSLVESYTRKPKSLKIYRDKDAYWEERRKESDRDFERRQMLRYGDAYGETMSEDEYEYNDVFYRPR